MKHKGPIIIITLLVLLVGVGFAYWYYFMHSPTSTTSTDSGVFGGFSPFNRQLPGGAATGSSTLPTTTVIPDAPAVTPSKPSILRLLSDVPVGGYGASTTATTTVVRWIDRGRGNIYEVAENSAVTRVISNTILPKIYESVWNKNLTAFIGTILEEDGSRTSVLFAEIKKRIASSTKMASTTVSDQLNANPQLTITPYELKGGKLPEGVITYAVSPKKDRIFMLVDEDGAGVGYVAVFNNGPVTRIFTSPLRQVTVEWPEDNTIAITTKGSADQSGYLYFVNPTNGTWKKILGPLPGLATKVSHDAKRVLISLTGNKGILTSIYNVAAGSGTDAVIRTIADKCTWGNFYKDIVYCGVPASLATATYPDDWYKGLVTFSDKIWQINASDNETHLISSIVDRSDRVIDAFNLGLDPKDNFLFFMNKNDLSLWSLDLVAGI